MERGGKVAHEEDEDGKIENRVWGFEVMFSENDGNDEPLPPEKGPLLVAVLSCVNPRRGGNSNPVCHNFPGHSKIWRDL